MVDVTTNVISSTKKNATKKSNATKSDATGTKASSGSSQSQTRPQVSTGDLVLGPITEWWGYIKVKSNYQKHYLGFLKITAVALGTALVLALVLGGILFGAAALAGVLLKNLLILVPFILFATIAYIAVMWVACSFKLTNVLFTDAQLSGKPFGLMASFNRIKIPVLKYLLTKGAILFVLLLPVLVLLGISLASMLSGNAILVIAGVVSLVFVYILFIIYAILVGVVFQFVTQFWVYGFLLEGKGIVESLKASYRLARSKILETAVFDIISHFISMALSIPFLIFYFVAYFGFMLLQLTFLVMPLAGMVMVGVALLVAAVIAMLLITIVELYNVPSHYLYWKKLKGLENKN